MENKNETVIKLTQTALLAVLCYVAFTYLQIKIPMPGGDATSLHIGNAFCVLGALLLGGPYGGLAGVVGMGIAKWSTATTFVNAVVSVILVSFLYNAVRPVLLRSRLLTVSAKAKAVH